MFQTARKDLSEAVTQAQKELSKLASDSAAPTAEDTSRNGEDASVSEPPDPAHVNPEARQGHPETSTSNIQTLFHLPESLRHASESIDLAQLRTNILNEFQRVQGVTRTQAEEYVHKSEVLVREAMKEAGEVLRDAVKILPPEDDQRTGFVWDGTDMWSLPELSDSTVADKGQRSELRAQGSTDLVASRAAVLLLRLKHDPAIVRHDPEADAGLRELYSTWICSGVDSKEGGMDGEEWSAKSSALLDEPVSGEALKATLDTLGSSVSILPFVISLIL